MGWGRAALVVLVGVATACAIPIAGGANQTDVSPGKYIVMLAPGVDPTLHARTKAISMEHSYRSVFRGYSAALSPAQLQSLRDDPEVRSVKASRVFHAETSGFAPAGNAVSQKNLTPQVPSLNVRRVGALLSPTAKINGIDERVDVDIAILDTGIQPDHPDLNVRGGTDCIQDRGKNPSWADQDGHGTLVAGITAAIDNGFGRVGIAPGARLWGVRVVDPKGVVEEVDLICGLEWLVAGGADIEVANMSLSGPGENINACSSNPAIWDALQHAICAAAGRGVTMVAAAGNESMDASTEVPGAYPDVMAVSAFAESDGLPGGLGPSTGSPPLGCEVDIADDTFAFFSNFGPTIDLSAPGVCVGSTFLRGTYAGGVGTSFAAPFVAGAAALYLANHPDATPDRVRDALVRQRERGPIAGDPDGINEGILNVSGL